MKSTPTNGSNIPSKTSWPSTTKIYATFTPKTSKTTCSWSGAYAIAPDNLYELICGVQRGIEGDWSEVTNNARKYAEEFLSIDGILHSYEMQVLIEDLKNS